MFKRAEAKRAERLLRLVRGEWLPGSWSAEARRFIPSLLIGLYVADREGMKLTKRDACALMNADTASSGPKYIKQAELAGFISIDRKPEEDRRKDFITATPRAVEIVHHEIKSIFRRMELDGSDATPDDDVMAQRGSKGLAFKRVVNGVIGQETIYLSRDEADAHYIARGRNEIEDGKFKSDLVLCTRGPGTSLIRRDRVDFFDSWNVLPPFPERIAPEHWDEMVAHALNRENDPPPPVASIASRRQGGK